MEKCNFTYNKEKSCPQNVSQGFIMLILFLICKLNNIFNVKEGQRESERQTERERERERERDRNRKKEREKEREKDIDREIEKVSDIQRYCISKH